MIASVFFASPDFSGIGPLLLIAYTCFPVFVLAAFHDRMIWPGVAQAILFAVGMVIQWKMFRHRSTFVRVVSALLCYPLINLASAVAVFFCMIGFSLASIRPSPRPPDIGTAEQRERIANASKLGDIAAVKALLQENPDLVSSKDKVRGETPLHWAANKEMAEFLLANMAQVDAIGENNQDTPLCEAAESGRLDVVEVLLAHGANINVTNVFNYTPLFEAVGQNHRDVVELLLNHHANANTYGDMGQTALDMAAKHGQKDMVDLLLSKGADINYESDDGTSLHKAVTEGDMATAGLLLSYNADVNAKDFHKETPLHLVGGNAAMTEFLLKNKADVHAQDDSGRTPLHRSAQSNSAAVAELLLANGADVTSSDASGKTPLHDAAETGGIEVAKALLAHSADINAKNGGGGTPLHNAVSSGHREMVDFLLANHADINARDGYGRTPLGIANQAYTELTNTSGQTKTRFGGPTADDYKGIVDFLEQQGGK